MLSLSPANRWTRRGPHKRAKSNPRLAFGPPLLGPRVPLILSLYVSSRTSVILRVIGAGLISSPSPPRRHGRAVLLFLLFFPKNFLKNAGFLFPASRIRSRSSHLFLCASQVRRPGAWHLIFFGWSCSPSLSSNYVIRQHFRSTFSTHLILIMFAQSVSNVCREFLTSREGQPEGERERAEFKQKSTASLAMVVGCVAARCRAVAKVTADTRIRLCVGVHSRCS
jgi:hypothetical protein